MLPIVVLAGCGSMDRTTQNGEHHPPNDGGPGETGPALELTDPPRASYVAVGPTTVGGVAREVTNVVVNGQTATLPPGQFALELPLEVGVNTFEASGVHDGATMTDMAAVLAGEFVTPSGLVRDAVQVHVSAAALAEAGPVVGGLVEPSLLDPSVQAMNPLMDNATAYVVLGTLSFGPTVVEIVPVQGALDLTIRLPDFVLPVDATIYDALPFGIDLELGVDVAADEVVLKTRVEVATDGQGGIVVDVGAIDAQLVGFDLDTGILELIDWLFLDDDDFAVIVEDQLAALGPTIEDMIDEMIAGLDLSIETELLEKTVTVGPSFDAVAIDPGGVALSLGLAIDVTGAPDGEGHLFLTAPPATEGGEIHVQLADDLLNRGLYELWAAGALDLDMELVDELAAVSVLFGGQGGGSMSMRSALPPVWVEKGGLARLQMGELTLTVDTPGGLYGERVELVMTLDAKADVSITAEAAGIVLSDGKVIMRLTGGSVGNELLASKLDQLEATFGIGIGMINGMLSFPLDGLLPEGTVLPEIVFERDPSGRGTVLELQIEDLIAILEGGTTTTTPTTPSNDVPVPGTAVVLGEDEVVPADGVVGWVCENTQVVAEGDAGTWYVEGDAELEVRGTGHVVYATDNASVVLTAPGNTVWMDPGADVDDDDGTNVVTELDPLNLDLTGAPAPGCGN